MTKYLFLAILFLVGLLAGTVYYSFGQRAKIDTLTEAAKQAVVQRKLDAATLAQYSANKAATARVGASVRRLEDKAVLAQPEWAEQALPAEVLDALE